MKRWGVVGVFTVLGLISTWAGLWLASRINFATLLGYPEMTLQRCWEIDECRSVPWWGVGLFIAGLLLPALVHAATGYRLATRKNEGFQRFIKSQVALSSATILFFIIATLAAHYISIA